METDKSGVAVASLPRAFPARTITLAGLFAALLAASAFVSIPTTPVPFTFQVLVVMLAALLLTPAQASLALATYLLVGSVGLPVFSGGHSGFMWLLAGPTGGFLWGFLAGAVLGSLVRKVLAKPGALSLVADVAAVAVVIVTIDLLGTVQLALVAHLAPAAAIATGVLPFLVFDIGKAVVAVVVASGVRRAMKAN